jgi:hypothetical protein
VETNTLDSALGTISEQQYAEFVGKTIDSVRNERSLGKGPPFIRVNRRTIKYQLEDVRQYLAEKTVRPVNEPTLTEARKKRGPTRLARSAR